MLIVHHVRQLFERIYKEQWLIIAVSAVILSLCVGWGLPDKKRMDLLIGGSPPTKRQVDLLASLRQEYLQEKEAKLKELVETQRHGQKTAIQWPLVSTKALSAILTEEDRLTAFREYILASSAGDERKVYSSLSRMNPRELDFDPRKYVYGGAFIYSVGGLLFMLKSVGLFHPTNDFGYYLKHPSNIARMYIAGRTLNVLAFLGTLILLAMFGNILENRLVGTLSMLTYAFSTVALGQSLITKSYMYASFWALLAIFLIFQYVRHQKLGFFVFSVLAAGWAFGSTVPNGIIAVSYPIFLLRRGRVNRP